MFYETELRFLQKMLDKCHLPSIVIDPEAPTQEYAPTTMPQWMHDRCFGETFYHMVPDLRSATVYRLLDVFLSRYIFLELAFCDQPSILLIGPYLTVSAVWTIADIFNALMALPNLIALILLSGIIAKDTKQYFKK